jgi:cytochrome c oxidase subunit 2
MFAPETPQPIVPGIHEGGVWLPKAGSTLAHDVDFGWNAAMWVSVIVFLTVIIPMFYFMWKYKRKSDTDKTIEIDHSTRMEIAWSVIPLGLVTMLFFIGLKGYLNAAVPPRGAYDINVQAQKWSWTFLYPNGGTSTELVVPVGKPVRLVMSSVDVIHSFYVPEFRVKQDVIPGQYTTAWFQATHTGETTLECAEYCGKDHSNMLRKVRVVEQPEFDKYVNGLVQIDVSVENGQKFYTDFGCVACHSLDGTAKPGGGPSFKGLYGKTETMADGSTVQVDENYLQESILNSQAKIVKGFQPIMPIFQGQLKDGHVKSLIMFIKAQK